MNPNETAFKPLFDNARKSAPLMELHEINALIEKAELRQSAKKGSHSSTQIILIMTSLISLIVTTLFLIPSFEPSEPTNPDISKGRSQPATKGVTQLTPKTDPVLIRTPLAKRSPKKLPVPDSSLMTQQLNLSGINLLKLEAEALEKLGVVACTNGISVPVSNGKNPLHLILTKDGTILGLNSKNDAIALGFSPESASDIMVIHKSGKSFPNPRFITDDLGQYWRAEMVKDGENILKDEERYREMQARLSVLIPVLVRTGNIFTKEDSIQMRWRPDVILWYEPDEEFLKILPGLIAGEIKKEKDELLRIMSNKSPEDSSGSIKETPETTSCKYFESCKSDRTLMSSVLMYPNPTKGELNVSIELQETRNLNFFVSDISGKTVLPLQKPTLQEKGQSQYHFDLSALPAGIYLLTVLTDKNERYTQRIVKE
jgi:hypothetical protein